MVSLTPAPAPASELTSISSASPALTETMRLRTIGRANPDRRYGPVGQIQREKGAQLPPRDAPPSEGDGQEIHARPGSDVTSFGTASAYAGRNRRDRQPGFPSDANFPDCCPKRCPVANFRHTQRNWRTCLPFDPEPAIKQGVRVKRRRLLRVSSAPKFQLWRQRRIAKSSDYRKKLSFLRPQRTICGFGSRAPPIGFDQSPTAREAVGRGVRIAIDRARRGFPAQ